MSFFSILCKNAIAFFTLILLSVVTLAQAPINDNCSNATLLTSGATCTNTTGTLLRATPTLDIPGDCGNPSSPEVWYKFVARSLYPTITLSNLGAQLTASVPKIQLLAGTCGSFTSLACVTGTTLNAGVTPGGAGLTIGTTYYIRIYTNSSATAGTNWGFRICITDLTTAPTVDYGRSYFNITKGSNGGTIEPGDVLEMRATFVVKAGNAFNVSFSDNIPANTTYVPNSLRILTNEGQLYKQWTDSVGDDPASYSSGIININLGTGATSAVGGSIKNTDRPSIFSSNCIVVATYRVTVDPVPFGTVINVGSGHLSYTSPLGPVSTVNFQIINAVVYKNYGICVNTVGSNGIIAEFGGTFGSGTVKDRGASGHIPTNYTYIPFNTNDPGDYKYGITNNTSPTTAVANYSIDPLDPTAAHHVFNVWDIIGDHTNATDPLKGNSAADVKNGATGGYMVVINASYRTDTAFLDTVKNLCPNTSYEYSAWFRNMCHNCSADSTGKSPTTAGYVPTGPGDSSGVHPNLTFNINGYDYYTTGDISYTGKWVKKGFTYRTGPSETQMIINIRNNAPGGGGNDWAIDDIGVSTCSPELSLNPSTPIVNVCYGDGVSLAAEVKSFFDNYTFWTWERSIDNGVTWMNTGYSGDGTIVPTFDGTQYIHTAVGPSFIGDSSTHHNIFRLRVASSAANLVDPNCSFAATRTVTVLVNNCMVPLASKLLQLSGKLVNKLSVLQWSSANEEAQLIFEVERSADGIHFEKAGTVPATAGNGAGATYTFTDPVIVTGATFYRIKLVLSGQYSYSNIISLNTDNTKLEVKALANPFYDLISFSLIAPSGNEAVITLYDSYGRQVLYRKQEISKGLNRIELSNLGALAEGSYTLNIRAGNSSITNRLLKLGK